MRLRTRLFLAWSALMVLLWAATLWQVQRSVTMNFERVAEESFAATRLGVDAVQTEQRKHMGQAGWLLMNIPELRALIAEAGSDLSAANVDSLNERLDTLSELIQADLVCVLNDRGALIAQNHRSPFATLEGLERFLSESVEASHLVRGVFKPAEVWSDQFGSVHGLWVNDGALFHAVGVPLVFQSADGTGSPPIDGALLMANRITDALTAGLRKGSNCEITFVVNGQAVASTLDAALRRELENEASALKPQKAFELDLGETTYRSWLETLRDPCSQSTVGAMLIQMSEAQLKSAQSRTSRMMLAILGTGLVLAALASFLVSAAVTRPIAALVDGVRNVARGNLDLSLDLSRRDELGTLASAFDNMVSQLRSRRELERQVEQSQAASRAKSRFLANMSHEIRTPLNGVMGMTQLLLGTPLNQQQRRYAELVKTSADILTSLINDVLDLSKIEAGKMELECIAFSPRSVVDQVAELLSVKARQKNIHLRVEISANVPDVVHGDLNRTRQVLLNLVTNAVKFTEDGHIAISATCQSTNPTHVVLKFAVKDTGIGIPADRLDRLFKSFSQVDASTTRKHGGTGLGLAICKQLAELMGGSIGVETQERCGSTFWFTAVYARQKRDALGSGEGLETCDLGREASGASTHVAPSHKPQAQSIQLPEVQRSTTVTSAAARILLAEDNEINQIVVSDMLANAGYTCEVVDDGAKAAAAIRSGQQYHLILMDCQMPVMDGFEAARQIRQHEQAASGGPRRRVPIIALTASAVIGDEQKCLDAGMDGYCTKPIDAAHLIATVNSFLRSGSSAPPTQTPAPEQQLSRDPIDFPSLLRRCSGNQALAKHVLHTLNTTLTDAVSDLKKHVDANDAATVAKVAHSIKGAAGMAGARGLEQAAAAMEQLGRAGDLAHVQQSLDSIAQTASQCQRYITNALGDHAPSPQADKPRSTHARSDC